MVATRRGVILAAGGDLWKKIRYAECKLIQKQPRTPLTMKAAHIIFAQLSASGNSKRTRENTSARQLDRVELSRMEASSGAEEGT
jgi:hypothetical protein